MVLCFQHLHVVTGSSQSEQTCTIINQVWFRAFHYLSVCLLHSPYVTEHIQGFLKLKKKNHTKPPLFQLLFVSFSYLEITTFASPVLSYTRYSRVCARWRPQILVKSLYSFTLGQYRFLFLIQEKLKLNITTP